MINIASTHKISTKSDARSAAAINGFYERENTVGKENSARNHGNHNITNPITYARCNQRTSSVSAGTDTFISSSSSSFNK